MVALHSSAQIALLFSGAGIMGQAHRASRIVVVSYRTIPCRIVSCRIVPYHDIGVMLCRVMSHRVCRIAFISHLFTNSPEGYWYHFASYDDGMEKQSQSGLYHE